MKENTSLEIVNDISNGTLALAEGWYKSPALISNLGVFTVIL